MKEYTKQEAYARATALCSKSEKCISDVRKKLYDWHVDADDHYDIIDALIDNKYIDEERFSVYYVRDKYRFNGWGRMKIRHQLSMKSIPSFLVEQALGEIDSEVYDEKMRYALQSKNRSIKTDDKYERRHKLMRFAAGRGYAMDEISNALDDILS